MGNQLELREGAQSIVKSDRDVLLGNYLVVQRRDDPSGAYFLKQQYIAESNSKIQEISHRIGRVKPFSNILTVKDIRRRQHSSVCGQAIPVYLYYDYYPETLRSEIKKRKQSKRVFSQQQIWFAINEISRGLAKLNQMGVTHWDVRPETIFKDQNDNLYILDSSFFVEPDRLRYFLDEKLRASIGNLSPEVIDYLKKGTSQYAIEDLGPSNDMFAFGVTILQMVYLRQPGFYYSSYGISTNKIEEDLYSMRKQYKTIANFARRLLVQQHRRSTIEDIRKQLRPQESQILRTVSLIESDTQSKHSSQIPTISYHHRMSSFPSPRKEQIRSPEKLSLTSLRRKTSNESGIRNKGSSRQYIIFSPRKYTSKFQFEKPLI